MARRQPKWLVILNFCNSPDWLQPFRREVARRIGCFGLHGDESNAWPHRARSGNPRLRRTSRPAMPVADSHRLPVIFGKNNKLKKCEDGNQGGDASFTLQVSESGPAVQYRYQQSSKTPEKVGEKAWEKGWRPSSTVPSNNRFTISGLEPVSN